MRPTLSQQSLYVCGLHFSIILSPTRGLPVGFFPLGYQCVVHAPLICCVTK